ncbi:hypothetical protein HDU93_004657, partial [Gonapodya sp. JEL0774]
SQRILDAITALSNRLGSLETKVDTITTTVNTLVRDVDAVNTTMNTLVRDVGALTTRVDRAANDMAPRLFNAQARFPDSPIRMLHCNNPPPGPQPQTVQEVMALGGDGAALWLNAYGQAAPQRGRTAALKQFLGIVQE